MNSLPMDKNIGQEIVKRQNTDDMLICLTAQRFLYSTAKKLFFWQLMLSTVIIILLSLFNLYKDISWIIAAYGALIAIFDVTFWSSLIKKRKEKAAKIQELFDTSVLNINWNKTLVGEKPTYEEIIRYSEKYKKRHSDFGILKNWYSPKISKIQSDAVKIICQRSNCTYDYAIRDSFSNAIFIVLGIMLLFLLVIGFVKGFTLQSFFLLVVFPLLPAIYLLLKTIKDNNASQKALDDLRSITESLWNKLLLDNKIDVNLMAREIQDKIFLNRKNSPLIFDWYYRMKRNQLEKEMDFSVDKLVQEYTSRKKDNNHA